MRSSILSYTGVFLAATTAVHASIPACVDLAEVSNLYSATGSDAASFCAAWNGGSLPSNKVTSPFSSMSVTQVSTACTCLAQMYGTCSPGDLAISHLTATYQDPQKICSWYTNTAATVSILNGLTANQALTACMCIIQNPALARAQSTPLAATSSRSTTTTSLTSPLTTSRSTTTFATTTTTTTSSSTNISRSQGPSSPPGTSSPPSSTNISRSQGPSIQPGTSSPTSTTTSTSSPTPAVVYMYGTEFYMQPGTATMGDWVNYNGGFFQFTRINSSSISTAQVAFSLNMNKTAPVTYPFKLRSDGTMISNPGLLNASSSDVVSLNAKTLVSARSDLLISDPAAPQALIWNVYGDVYGAPWITVSDASRVQLFIYACPQATGSPLIYVGYASTKSGCLARLKMNITYKK